MYSRTEGQIAPSKVVSTLGCRFPSWWVMGALSGWGGGWITVSWGWVEKGVTEPACRAGVGLTAK